MTKLTEDFSGNMFLFGMSGTGKSVFLENLIVADGVAERGGLLIDPFGDLVKDVSEYLDAQVYKLKKGTVKENLQRFEEEINLAELNNKFLLCNLNYFEVGPHLAREVGLLIIKKFLALKELNNLALYVDEAHNFLDPEIVKHLTSDQLLHCVLSDASINYYSNDDFDLLQKSTEKIVCFKLNKRTAKIIAEKYNFECSADDLQTIEKYHYYLKLSRSEAEQKLKSVFPLPYPKK